MVLFSEKGDLIINEISLSGKHSIVTGGGTGIGFAVAKELLDAGSSVTIIGRRESVLKDSVLRLGKKCNYQCFDMTNFSGYGKIISKIENENAIDILVNCAGINIKKDFLDFNEKDYDTLFEIQGKAPFFITQEVAKYMKIRQKGSVILISSLSANIGMHNIQAYSFCKGGIVSLVRSLALDLGKYGIRVNSLNPGFVYTEMLKQTNLDTPERLTEISKNTPLQGFAKEKDIGLAAAFLASDAARFITGIDLVVDGGLSNSFLL